METTKIGTRHYSDSEVLTTWFKTMKFIGLTHLYDCVLLQNVTLEIDYSREDLSLFRGC